MLLVQMGRIHTHRKAEQTRAQGAVSPALLPASPPDHGAWEQYLRVCSDCQAVAQAQGDIERVPEHLRAPVLV